MWASYRWLERERKRGREGIDKKGKERKEGKEEGRKEGRKEREGGGGKEREGGRGKNFLVKLTQKGSIPQGNLEMLHQVERA